MKKLLNTLYLTQDNFYLTRERDNIVKNKKEKSSVVSRIELLMVLYVFLTWEHLHL